MVTILLFLSSNQGLFIPLSKDVKPQFETEIVRCLLYYIYWASYPWCTNNVSSWLLTPPYETNFGRRMAQRPLSSQTEKHRDILVLKALARTNTLCSLVSFLVWIPAFIPPPSHILPPTLTFISPLPPHFYTYKCSFFLKNVLLIDIEGKGFCDNQQTNCLIICLLDTLMLSCFVVSLLRKPSIAIL